MRYPHLDRIELAKHKKIKGGFEILKMKCCDCGLIHKLAFAIEENGKLGIAIERATKLARRKRQIKK